MRQILASIALFLTGPLAALTISTPVTVSITDGTNLSSFVAINEKGEAAVIWSSIYVDDFSLVASTLNRAKVWSPPHIIKEKYSLSLPKVKIDADGNVKCLWIDTIDDEHYLQTAKKQKNEAWTFSAEKLLQLPEAVNYNFLMEGDLTPALTANQLLTKLIAEITDGATPFLGATAVSPKGRGFLVYCSLSSGYFWDSYSIKGRWLEEGVKTIDIADFSPNCSYYFFQNSVNDEDQIGVVWSKWEQSNGQPCLEATVCLDGEWSKPVDIAVGNGIRQVKSKIDPEGNFLVVCARKEKKEKNLFAAYKPKGQPWVHHTLFTSNSLDVKRFEISCSKGHFVIVWDETAGREGTVRGATLSTATETWSPIRLSPPEMPCIRPDVAFNEQGKGLISWETIIDGGWQIQAAELSLD